MLRDGSTDLLALGGAELRDGSSDLLALGGGGDGAALRVGRGTRVDDAVGEAAAAGIDVAQSRCPLHTAATWHVGHCEAHTPPAQMASAEPRDMQGHASGPRSKGVESVAGRGERLRAELRP